MELSPIRNRKKAYCVCAAVMATAVMLFVLSFVSRVLFPYCFACNVILLVFFICFAYRYVVQSFLYRLRDDETCVHNRFEVIGYLTGKQGCKVLFERPFQYLDMAMPYKMWKKISKKMKNESFSFEYLDLCPDFMPDFSFVFVFNYENNVTAIRLQVGDGFTRALIARAGLNRDILKTE